MLTALRRLRGGRGAESPVEAYWTRHTVNSRPFRNAQASANYLEWRFDEYPLFRELTGLWGDHDGELILDYGCGPGNDVTGFLLNTRAAKVIGVDVSTKALALASRRLALHEFPPRRYDLIRIAEIHPELPLPDGSVDHVNSGGVIHHVSDPGQVLRELRRVSKNQGSCTIMVYNRDSIFFHLYTAYMKVVLERRFAGLDVEEAFRRNTDGVNCPISRAYRWPDFLELCREAGFAGEFAGGYFLRTELQWLREHRADALACDSLGDEHKEFLRELSMDEAGYPTYRGKHAGIGGVYRLTAT